MSTLKFTILANQIKCQKFDLENKGHGETGNGTCAIRLAMTDW